jgi:hypothetical protein
VFTVDRILNQQKVERVRAEAARSQLERERKEAQQSEKRSMVTSAGQQTMQPPPPVPEKGPLVNRPPPTSSIMEPQPKGNSRQSVLGTLSSFRQKMAGSTVGRSNDHETQSLLGPPEAGGSSVHAPRAPSPSGQITSQDNIGTFLNNTPWRLAQSYDGW